MGHQLLAALRETEEKNKDLENKVAELREALEMKIAQQQNAGVSWTRNARAVIEHCEIVKQPLTLAMRAGVRVVLNVLNSREIRDTENSTGTLPIVSDRAEISECDRGDISEQINEVRRDEHERRQRPDRARDEQNMPEIPLSFRLKEAINSFPKFDGSNLPAFVRSCKRAASSVPPALEAE